MVVIGQEQAFFSAKGFKYTIITTRQRNNGLMLFPLPALQSITPVILEILNILNVLVVVYLETILLFGEL